jgi:flavodoxin I
MKFQVIFFSRKGSTKKVADAIASELNLESEDVKTAELKNDSMVFLGSGCYGGKPGKHITKFIENNDFKSRNVALFGTSGGGEGKETEAMETMLKDKNANIKGRYFCKGKAWFTNKDKPSNEDLDDARKFAKKMIK